MRSNGLAQIVETSENEILNEWLGKLKEAGAMSAGRMSAQDLTAQCQQFLKAFKTALSSGADVKSDAYGEIRAMLEQISRSRALQGYSPSETATFIFSLKEPLFNRLNAVYGRDASQIGRGVLEVTTIVDKLGLLTFETFVKAREEVINRQSREIAELSTARGETMGWYSRPSAHRHPRQRPHPGRHGDALGNNRAAGRADCNYRHNGRAYRRYACRTAFVEDGGGHASHGRRLHHLRDPAADRPDHGASRRRVECGFEGDFC